MMKIDKKFLVLCIGSFIFAYFCGGNLPYTIFYIFILILVFGLAYCRISYNNIKVRVGYKSENYVVGDEETFPIIIENNKYTVIPYVHIVNETISSVMKEYNGNVINLDLNEVKIVKQKISFGKRGIYNIGIVKLTLKDIFLLFSIDKIIDNEQMVKVYPKIYPLDNFTISSADNYENIIKSQNGIEDMTLIKDIRKYRTGDNLRKVHWKLSAKHNELYVKNFDNISGIECNLILNMTEQNYSFINSDIYEEKMIDFCVSLINNMITKSIRSRIFVNAFYSRTFNIENSFDMDEILEYLTIQKSDGKIDFSEFINYNLKHIAARGWIGIITINVDESLRNTIIDLNDSGYKVTVFYCNERNLSLDNIKKLKKFNIPCINFYKLLCELEK